MAFFRFRRKFMALSLSSSLGEIGRLMMVGSSRLTMLLTRRTSIRSLKLIIPDQSSEKLDSWFSSFPFLLTSLSVFFGTKSNRIAFNNPQILPKTLTKLEIDRDIPFDESFREAFFELDEIIPEIQYLSLPISLSLGDTEWMTRWPSTIESLTLYGYDTFCPLPPSLTALTILISFKWHNNTKFPNLLTEMSIPWYTKGDLSILAFILPESLTSLIYNPRQNDTTSSLSIDALPRRLRKLKLKNWMKGLQNDDWLLPPTLTELMVLELNDMMQWMSLPRTLVKLSIVRVRLERDQIGVCTAALPQNLLHFECSNWYKTHSEKSNPTEKIYLPCGLQTFHFEDQSFGNAALSSIPSSITSLALKRIRNEVIELPKWPNLKQLKLNEISLHLHHCCHLSRNSPLIESIVVSNSERSPRFLFNRITEPNAMKSHLRFFSPIHPLINTPDDHYTIYDFHINSPFMFGNHLRSVIFERPIDFVSDHFMVLLPPSLTHLRLASFFITNNGIQHLQHCINLLKLELPHAIQITGASFTHLPRGITHLNLNKCHLIFEPDLPSLPRSITTLHIDSATALMPSAAAFLPPQVAIQWLSQRIEKQKMKKKF